MNARQRRRYTRHLIAHLKRLGFWNTDAVTPIRVLWARRRAGDPSTIDAEIVVDAPTIAVTTRRITI